jgi:misacylated tRNA(Ala) deacylase
VTRYRHSGLGKSFACRLDDEVLALAEAGGEPGWYRGLFSPSPYGGGLFVVCGHCHAKTGMRAASIFQGRRMTELLYYQDAYCQRFDASIRAVETQDGKTRVALDRTAFYPGGGGQPNDEGTLTISGHSYAVVKVNKEGEQIWHTLAQEVPSLSVGDPVQGQLNWERRYALMRTHTAMHILCGVVWRDYGASVTGGNMDPGSGRMDFEFASLTREMISEIEAKCNAEVAAARPVRAQLLPREEAFQIPDLIRTKINLLPEGIMEIRTVELVGLDLQADGGTHVRNTQEVGSIKVVDYKSKGAINKRIYIELG